MDSGMAEDKKFNRTEISNPIALRDGSKPLTVISFSFTNETRDVLKVVLKQHALGHTKDAAALARIIENPDYFPQEVLTELKKLYKDDNAATVYVIENLPEF